MKLLRLSLLRIQSFARNSRGIFVLFLVGCMLSTFVFLFFYGNSMPHKVDVIKDEYWFKLYQIILQEPIPLDGKLQQLLEGYEVECAHISVSILQTDFELSDEERMPTQYTGAAFGIQPFFIESDIYDSPSVNLIRGNIEYFQPNSNTALLSNNVVRTGYPLSSIAVRGKEYQVVGEYTFNVDAALLLPYQTYSEDIGVYDNIYILMKEPLSEEENQVFLKKMQSLYDVYRRSTPGDAFSVLYNHPGDYYRNDREKAPEYMLLISSIYIIAVLSFMYIFLYLIESNLYESAVYSVLGATQRRMFAVILLDNVLLTTAAGGLTCLLHWLLYDSLVSRLNVYPGITYTAADYFIVLGFAVLLSALTLLPFIRKYRKMQAVSMKNALTN